MHFSPHDLQTVIASLFILTAVCMYFFAGFYQADIIPDNHLL